MQAHDDPELRARVRAELLYPTKPVEPQTLTSSQMSGLRGLYQIGRSVAWLSLTFEIPEGAIWDAIRGGHDAQAA